MQRLRSRYLRLPIGEVLVLAFFGLTAVASAETQPFPYREWNDASGQFSVTARFVSIQQSNVTLERKDNGEPVIISQSKLSSTDRIYIRDLRRQQADTEKANDAIKSLALFRQKVDPYRDELVSTRQNDETSTQYQDRLNSAYRSILGIAAREEFSVFAEVKDVHQSEITYDFMSQLNMNFESPTAASQRRANEAAYFDVRLVERAYPMVVPTLIRVKIGPNGAKLKVGDSIQIECTSSRASRPIGRLDLTVPDTNAELQFSIVAIDQVKSDSVALYLASLTETKGLRLRIDSRKITGEQFMSEVKRMGNAEFSLPALIPDEDFEKRFGQPFRKRAIPTGEMWGFECSDGIVLIWVRKGVEQLYPNAAFIERMVLDTEHSVTP